MSKQDTGREQTSVRSDFLLDATLSGHKDHFCGCHGAGCGIVSPIILELLRHVPALSCEESEVILFLITELHEIHILCLVDGRAVLDGILPFVTWNVLRYFVECLRSGRSGSSANSNS